MDNILTHDKAVEDVHLAEGALVLVDKPLTWTSFDVVNKIRYGIRRRLGVKKYKVGHAGTLDPLATGLLLICIGKYTKKIEQLMGLDKSYESTIQLGADTPSMDAEHLPHIYYPFKSIRREELAETTAKYTGVISQIPPMYSAIKVNGKALYKSARSGQTVARNSRNIKIHELECVLDGEERIDVKVKCSKGTYIRTLGQDIAHDLGTGGYLSYLRRTQIGEYDVTDAYHLDHLISSIDKTAS